MRPVRFRNLKGSGVKDLTCSPELSLFGVGAGKGMRTTRTVVGGMCLLQRCGVSFGGEKRHNGQVPISIERVNCITNHVHAKIPLTTGRVKNSGSRKV